MRAKAVLLLPFLAAAAGQQTPDPNFRPDIGRPAHEAGAGPRVAIDAAHHNFHTADGRYSAFADLLRRDGCRVSSSDRKFAKDDLAEVDVLVVSNALHESNASDWAPPNPSAFTGAEIETVVQWVRAGGSLLLIADHQPFAGAASDLAKPFGIQFENVYAADGPPEARQGSLTFRKQDGSLADHPVTQGVDAVANFGGSAFRLAGPHTPLLQLSKQAVGGVRRGAQMEWAPIGDCLQGALLVVGQGRVAVFAEAAMFSAQLAGPQRRPMGMNAPNARDNPRFLLNVLHWLAEGRR